MFKRNKQKGFISAELGIGILVVSLLTIMGFLAATDLDDEISRTHDSAPTAVSSVIHALTTLQEKVNDQTKFLALFNELADNEKRPQVMAETFGMVSDTDWKIHSSASYRVWYAHKSENSLHISFDPHQSGVALFQILLYTQETCNKYLSFFKDALPKFVGDIECVSEYKSADMEQKIEAGGDWLEGGKTDSSLEGTWMGDL